MKVYDVVTPYTGRQTKSVVAKNMAEAERIFLGKYWPTTIIEIKLHSEYVQIQEHDEQAKEGGGVCKWISVEDRLPETSGGYLIFDYGCENASYQPSTNTWDSNHELDVKPTHWMPLPDPPRTYKKPV